MRYSNIFKQALSMMRNPVNVEHRDRINNLKLELKNHGISLNCLFDTMYGINFFTIKNLIQEDISKVNNQLFTDLDQIFNIISKPLIQDELKISQQSNNDQYPFYALPTYFAIKLSGAINKINNHIEQLPDDNSKFIESEKSIKWFVEADYKHRLKKRKEQGEEIDIEKEISDYNQLIEEIDEEINTYVAQINNKQYNQADIAQFKAKYKIAEQITNNLYVSNYSIVSYSPIKNITYIAGFVSLFSLSNNLGQLITGILLVGDLVRFYEIATYSLCLSYKEEKATAYTVLGLQTAIQAIAIGISFTSGSVLPYIATSLITQATYRYLGSIDEMVRLSNNAMKWVGLVAENPQAKNLEVSIN